MGRYNPDAPRLLGQEWVPIRDEEVTFSPGVNIQEIGHGFTLTQPRQVSESRIYVDSPAPGPGFGQTIFTSIYPRGTEDQSGPIKSVIIPCNNGGITGTGFSPQINGSSIAQALLSPSDAYNVSVLTGIGTLQLISLFFATNAYAAQLTGKRILAVNLLYTASGGAIEETLAVIAANPASQDVNFTNLTGDTPVNTRSIQKIRFGDVNYFWDPTQNVNLAFNVLPWKYPDLQRFEISATNRLRVQLEIPAFSSVAANSWSLNYAALEVVYCEDKRVAIGGRIFYGDFNPGMNPINMYANQGYTTNPVLPTGDYDLVVSSGDSGDLNHGEGANSTYPTFNALREMYQIPSHPGIKVNIPFPIDDSVGKTLTAETYHVLPQLSLHTSGGPLIEPHVYGRQAVAQVYGTNTAIQGIDVTPLNGVSTLFPQVRFICRRFADTTVPLLLDSPTIAGSTVTLTPSAFDALPEILDGWKEVTLPFTTIPSMGTVVAPQWRFSAPGETAGNRWEVLGAVAPSVSGTPANLLTLSPYPGQLGPATYGNDGTNSFRTPSFISAGAAAAGNNASVVPGLPVGATTGDLLLIFAAIRNSGTGTVNTPTGYTSLLTFGNMSLFGKIHTGTESAPTVSFTGGVANADTQAQMSAFRNVDMGSLISTATLLNGSAQNITYPAATYNLISGVAIHVGWKQDDWTSVASGGGATQIGAPSTTTGDDQGITWAYTIQSGSTGYAGYTDTVTGGAAAISRGALAVFSATSAGGTAIDLDWMPGYAPAVTVTTDDPSSDAFIIFAQNMPTITGMAISVLSQPVTGIGQNCGIDPIFIPETISYNRITWPSQQIFTVNDDFSRVSAAGWGIATSGQLWSENGGVGTDYTVNGTSGVVTMTAAGSSRHTSILTSTFLDIDGYGQISMPTTPTVAMTWGSLTWHKESATNDMYQAEIDWLPDGSVALALRKWVGGVDTVLATIAIGYGYVLGTKYNLRIQQRGSSISARAWLDGTEEPAHWQLNIADSDLDIAAGVGTRARIDAGGGTPQVVAYDNILFSDPLFGYFELQRSDTVDQVWQTIMKAYSPQTVSFNDYEARVGIVSSYRIRAVSILEFAGPWSSTVTSTIPAPGLTGREIVADSHVLIFTSNQSQSGRYSLAYSLAWEGGDITEQFGFPEAGFVTMQAQFNKNFYTAFRPLERGGEEFNRTILVQAAAIAPETLADFKAFRDMAWFNVNYVCVRDEDGNRWFATVIVPTGRVRRDRRLYFADFKVMEVTDTPTPVDPLS